MNIELILSIYASIVSSLLLLWKIFTYFNDRKTIIKVDQKIVFRYSTTSYELIRGSEIELLVTTITNVSSHTVHIEKPRIKTNRKHGGSDTFTAYFREEMDINYPRVLSPGERIECSMPIEGIKENILKINKSNKIKSIVKDTRGKEFSSKWLEIK